MIPSVSSGGQFACRLPGRKDVCRLVLPWHTSGIAQERLYVRSLPLSELKARLKVLPKGKKIVAYCRGRFAVQSLVCRISPMMLARRQEEPKP